MNPMSVVTAMSSRPPPPTSRNGTRPKPPQKRPPPPPPSHKRPPPPPSSLASSTTSTGGVVKSNFNGVNGNKRKRIGVISIRKPVELRDVNVFTRKNKLGEGTYG